MTQARPLIEDIRRALQPVDARLRQHRYVEAVETGRLPRDQLHRFIGEQYAIIGSDLRSVAHLVARFGGSSSRAFFLSTLQGERAAWDALLVFARALGLPEPDLHVYEPLPGAHAYTDYMAWLALYGSAAEVAAAYLVNFPVWGETCARLSRALKTRYGLQESDVSFFDLFAEIPAEFEGAALAVIQEDLDRDVEPRWIHRAARLLQGYELLYWDTLYEAWASGSGG